MQFTLANPYLTHALTAPSPQSYREARWRERGYHPALRPISPDSEAGTLIGQMGWVGAHAHAHHYLWASAGNMGARLSEPVDAACLIPSDAAPRYPLPPQIVVPGLAGKHVLLTKSGARLDMIAAEHPALNVTIIEVEPDGTHYRMRFGTPTTTELTQTDAPAPKPTSEMFHYLLIFERLADTPGFTALVHLQPKFLNLISRTAHGHPERFYAFLRGYEPETPIIYDASSGIGFVQERAPGIPELSYESLRLFENAPNPPRHILYWVGHGTFSRGDNLLDAYKHAEYFEAAARMAWEANQQNVDAQAYTEEIVNCILREFAASRIETDRIETGIETGTGGHSDNGTDILDTETEPPENLYNYP